MKQTLTALLVAVAIIVPIRACFAADEPASKTSRPGSTGSVKASVAVPPTRSNPGTSVAPAHALINAAATNPASAASTGSVIDVNVLYANKPAAASAQPSRAQSWWTQLWGNLRKASWSSWAIGLILLGLLYSVLFRVFALNVILKDQVAEIEIAKSGFPEGTRPHHPALLAIQKWTEIPAASIDRAYRWLDGEVNDLFGTLIGRGELLRSACLQVSFGSTVFCFMLAMAPGQGLDQMMAQISKALGVTLVGLLLFLVESWTLSRLYAEAARLEFEGREFLDNWAANRVAPSSAVAAAPSCEQNPSVAAPCYEDPN